MVTRRLLSVVGAACAALLTACAHSTQNALADCPPSRFRSDHTLIIAHASGDWFGPSNSLEMLAGAKAAGADLVDLDVRVTADGELVGGHDDRIGNQTISSATLTELSTIDLRDTWRNPDHRVIGNPVRVPTVQDLFDAFPDTGISLEFKITGGEQALCDLLTNNDRLDDVYVSSAGDAAIDTFKALCPAATTTVTDAMVPIMQQARSTGEPWCAPVPIGQPPLQAGSGSTAFRLTADGVEWEQAHGLAVYTWTADDDASLRYVGGLGVDGVYTARADLARRILRP